MQSTRAWLAGAIEGDAEYLRRGMADWLLADGSLGIEAAGLRRICRRVLRDLRAWLRGASEESRARARAALRAERPAHLARTFLLEYLKLEGALDGLPRGCRGEVHALLDTFFGASATPLPGAVAPEDNHAGGAPGAPPPAPDSGTGRPAPGQKAP